MAFLINAQSVNIASGTQEFGSVNIPNNLSQMIVRLRRRTATAPTMWPNTTTTVSLTMFVAFDGVNFIEVGGFTSAGGIVTNRQGGEIPETVWNTPVLARTNGRKARWSVTVTNGPLVSELTAEIL